MKFLLRLARFLVLCLCGLIALCFLPFAEMEDPHEP